MALNRRHFIRMSSFALFSVHPIFGIQKAIAQVVPYGFWKQAPAPVVISGDARPAVSDSAPISFGCISG